MKKNHYKIIISSFIVGIIILTVAMFTNESSDLAFNKNSQLASTGQLAQTPSIQNQVNVGSGSTGTTTSTTGYTAISGLDFEAAKTGQAADSNFIALLRTIFNWGIAAAIILATLAVVVGSVQYMTTDAVFDKKEGKKRIQSAIGGLILALMSWLILFSINENIFSSNFLLKLQNLEEEKRRVSEEKNSGGVEAVDPAEEYLRNGQRADLLMATAESIKSQRLEWVRIKEECFDNDGNYIEPPINKNLCGKSLIKLAGISGVNASIATASDKETELYIEARDLYSRNIQISNNTDTIFKLEDVKEQINEVEEVKDNINSESGSNQGSGETGGTNSSNYFNNEGQTVTIEDLINANNQNSDIDGVDSDNQSEPNDSLLNDGDRNVLAFQDKAFENIFIQNESANIFNLPNELESMLLVFRDTCCGGKTIIAGTETYKNSFNVSDIYSDNNSFLIEKSFTDGYGANSWVSLNNLVIKNTYPDQNLLDITEYLDCVDARSRWIRWSCNKPDDYRDIEGRYYNIENKGIILSDLLQERSYDAKIKGLDSEVIYKNNTWLIKVN